MRVLWSLHVKPPSAYAPTSPASAEEVKQARIAADANLVALRSPPYNLGVAQKGAVDDQDHPHRAQQDPWRKPSAVHGFVYLQGCTARDPGKDIKGQTTEILAQIDQILETHGTDKTRLLQAQIWLTDIRNRMR